MLPVSLPDTFNNFFLVFLSIIIEGIPFILIGAILSGLVETFVSREKIASLIPRSKFWGFLMMALMGSVLPVCECGNIPFARRMILKQVPAHFALTFLLAAPTFNPLVIASTLAAFPGNYSVTIWRLVFSLIIAVSIGYIFSFIPKNRFVIKDICKIDTKKHTHHHHHTDGTLHGFARLVQEEFLEMMSIFIFGAIIASSIQIFLPSHLIASFNSSTWVAILAMMLLGFVVSICSNVDAFFALAYARIFPMSSILGFLVLGPMIDIKAIPMFKTIFQWKALMVIICFVSTFTFLLSYLYFLLT